MCRFLSWKIKYTIKNSKIDFERKLPITCVLTQVMGKTLKLNNQYFRLKFSPSNLLTALPRSTFTCEIRITFKFLLLAISLWLSTSRSSLISAFFLLTIWLLSSVHTVVSAVRSYAVFPDLMDRKKCDITKWIAVFR